MKHPLAVILIIAFFYQLGWARAHGIVAQECRKLGKFYVGDSVYLCNLEKETP